MPDTKPAMQPNRSAADAVPLTLPQFTKADYSSFFLAGALCCTITHGAMTPIDVIKTRIQISPSYSSLSFIPAARKLISTEGASALLTGFGPTAVGYFVQGGAKCRPLPATRSALRRG